MAKKSKKRSRQAKRRAERRDAKQEALPEPTPGAVLLTRIRTEAHARRDAEARRLERLENERQRRAQRARARGEV